MPPTKAGHQLLNWASHIDTNTLEQARETASMPFVSPHVALMPDAHAGKGSAVGTVIPTNRAVIPAAVGVDIGCGMIAARTQFTNDDIDDLVASTGTGLDVLRHAIEAAIPLSPGNYNLTEALDKWYAEPKIQELTELAERNNIDLTHSRDCP